MQQYLMSLFLAIQPVILLQTATNTELPANWLAMVMNGGIGVMMFVVWWFTLKTMNSQQQEFQKQQQEFTKSIIEMVKQDNQYKELLAGILSRLEYKIDNPKSKEKVLQ